jgi:hypothetical protein
MSKKILVVLETIEQGMERKEGGVIKLFKGQKLAAAQTEHGLQVTLFQGRVRTVPKAILEGWVTAGHVRVEDAEPAPAA